MFNKLVDILTQAKTVFLAAPLFAQILIGLLLVLLAFAAVNVVFKFFWYLVLAAAVIAAWYYFHERMS